MMLVSLAQARAHIRSDDTDDDADLTLKVKAASRAVLNYIDDTFTFEDSSGEPSVDSSGVALGIPDDVRIATLLLVGYFYSQRDEDGNHEYEMGYLPRPVTALLYQYRTPGCR